jgi:predicted regulator of Ras-like GTPase activity (Roadblock/LC7/MglB family)
MEASLSPVTDGQTAIDELKEISTQVEAAVLVGTDGKVLASTLSDARAERLATTAKNLLEEAGRLDARELRQLEVATGEGSLFAVREGDLLIAATTGPGPTTGLIFYDLKSSLRRAAEKPKPKPKPKPRRKPASGGKT